MPSHSSGRQPPPPNFFRTRGNPRAPPPSQAPPPRTPTVSEAPPAPTLDPPGSSTAAPSRPSPPRRHPATSNRATPHPIGLSTAPPAPTQAPHPLPTSSQGPAPRPSTVTDSPDRTNPRPVRPVDSPFERPSPFPADAARSRRPPLARATAPNNAAPRTSRRASSTGHLVLSAPPPNALASTFRPLTGCAPRSHRIQSPATRPTNATMPKRSAQAAPPRPQRLRVPCRPQCLRLAPYPTLHLLLSPEPSLVATTRSRSPLGQVRRCTKLAASPSGPQPRHLTADLASGLIRPAHRRTGSRCADMHVASSATEQSNLYRREPWAVQ